MGNGVYFKMIECCHMNKSTQNGDIDIDKNNLKNNQYINYKVINIHNQILTEDEIQNKKDQKLIDTKSKQSSGSGSFNKIRQIFAGENMSNKDPNLSVCNNTYQMNNSNFVKNNLVQNNLNNKFTINPIDYIRHKTSIMNYSKISHFSGIKTKLQLMGDLFNDTIIEIDKFGMKNGLRQKRDGLSVFGIKEKNNDLQNNNKYYDYYIDLDAFDGNEFNNKISGKVFEIYIRKKTKNYTLYFLHNSLILYYKINNNVFFELNKDYYLILGDIFLTITVKKSPENNQKIIQIQTEIENEKEKKYVYEPKEMPIKIGRVNCHINIPRPSISKLHSIIDYMDDDFYYKDCGSTNGSTLLVREDDSLIIKGEMSFKLEDISFKIKEVEDEDNCIEENFGE
jgi:hypothetical protein